MQFHNPSLQGPVCLCSLESYVICMYCSNKNIIHRIFITTLYAQTKPLASQR